MDARGAMATLLYYQVTYLHRRERAVVRRVYGGKTLIREGVRYRQV